MSRSELVSALKGVSKLSEAIEIGVGKSASIHCVNGNVVFEFVEGHTENAFTRCRGTFSMNTFLLQEWHVDTIEKIRPVESK